MEEFESFKISLRTERIENPNSGDSLAIFHSQPDVIPHRGCSSLFFLRDMCTRNHKINCESIIFFGKGKNRESIIES